MESLSEVPSSTNDLSAVRPSEAPLSPGSADAATPSEVPLSSDSPSDVPSTELVDPPSPISSGSVQAAISLSEISEALLDRCRASNKRFSIKSGVDIASQLRDDQDEIMISELIGDTIITFSHGPEQLRQRNKSKIVPGSFWRTSYETSITLSANTSKAMHAKHRQNEDLRLDARNLFQAVAPWTLSKDLTRERIERHLIWNKKKDPSSYISTFNSSSGGEYRAVFHYVKSERIGQRVFVVQINNDGLVAATVSSQCRTIVKIIKKHRFKVDVIEEKEYFFNVDIPVWIRDPRKPEDRSDLTVEQFEELGADMWISITELRGSNLSNGPKSRVKASRDYICAKGHDYEWLSCGPILKSHKMSVMPYDGKVLHTQRTTKIVRSLNSTDPWVWDWDEERWVLDAALTDIAEWRDLEAHNAREALKRKTEGLNPETEEQPVKRMKAIKLKLVRPYLNFQTRRKKATLAH